MAKYMKYFNQCYPMGLALGRWSTFFFESDGWVMFKAQNRWYASLGYLALVGAMLLGTQLTWAQGMTYLGITEEGKTTTQTIQDLVRVKEHLPADIKPEPRAARQSLSESADLTPAEKPLIAKPPFTKPVRIGVQHDLLKSTQSNLVLKTRDHIMRLYGRSWIQVFYLNNDDLATALRTGQIDVFMADADFFTMQETLMPVEAMASLWPTDSDSPQSATASVIVMRRTGKPGEQAPELHDLATRKLVASSPESLSGWLAAAVELKKHHVFIDDDPLPNTQFTDGNVRKVFSMMNATPGLVGVLPACELEYLSERGDIRLRDYWVINPKIGDGLRCVHSTQLYPGWMFAAAPTTPANVKKAITTALFTMDGKPYGAEWSTPVSTRPIYDLFYTLRIGPYRDLAQWSFSRFVRNNAEYLALAAVALFMVLTYAGTLSVLVRRRTKLLRQALEERDRADQEAQASREHIENLERTGLVGQMSTVIAHELKQPLGAVNNYANALLRRLRRGDFNEERFEMALKEIVEQSMRASQIVERVRAYAKHDHPPRQVDDISNIIESAIQTFRRSRNTKASVVVRMRPKSLAEVDSWEIELAILNLLKNAADALVGTTNPRIDVVLEPANEREWRLTVGDNGPYLTDEQLAKFFKPLQTSKGDKGMGLGLSIVANIAERHAGNITVARNGERGVKFTIIFPKFNDPNLEAQVPWPTGAEELVIYQSGGNGPVIRKTLREATQTRPSRGVLQALDYEGYAREDRWPNTVHTTSLNEAMTVMEAGEPISKAETPAPDEATLARLREREIETFIEENIDIDESEVPHNA